MLIAGWHLPLFFLEEDGLRFDALVPGLVTTMAVTYWYTWLFNRSGGSALLTLVAHNLEGVISAEPWTYLIVWTALALVLLIADHRRWRAPAPRAATNLPTDHPAARSRAEDTLPNSPGDIKRRS